MMLRTLAATAALALLTAAPAVADPVSTGVVIRGVTVPGNGVSGAMVPGRTCDFSGEETTQTGHMTGASVQCRTQGNLTTTLPGLPQRFNAYCVMQARNLGGARLIEAPRDENANHCDLSGMTPADATQRFGGATWR